MSNALLEKLGLGSGRIGIAIGRPPELDGEIDLPETSVLPVDGVVAFVRSTAEVEARLAEALPHYRRGGHFWWAYPKKTGAIRTDITRDHGWEPLAAQNLLPVTQVAIDATWSALRFRYRDEINKLTRKSDLPGRAL